MACSVVCSFPSERVWTGDKVLHLNKSGPARQSPFGHLDVGFAHTASRCRCQEVRAPLGSHLQGGKELGAARTRAGGVPDPARGAPDRSSGDGAGAAEGFGHQGRGRGRRRSKGCVTGGGAGAG